MKPMGSNATTQTENMNSSTTCLHRRLFSDDLSEEERAAGMVRCVECGGMFPEPLKKSQST
ncbi:MAG: hypothetical protein LZF62_450037 [Nitrospira sp.]|nr:MAG: hypothetical protein LZF62_450037 [Nitrospira sp.]